MASSKSTHTPHLPRWRKTWRTGIRRRLSQLRRDINAHTIYAQPQSTASRSRQTHQRFLPFVLLLLGGTFLLIHAPGAPFTPRASLSAGVAPTASSIGRGGAAHTSTSTGITNNSAFIPILPPKAAPTAVGTPSAAPPSSTDDAPTVFGVNLGNVFNGIIRWIVTQCGNFLQWLIDWLTDFGFLYTTPAGLTYKNATVIALHQWILSLNVSIVGLILIIGGYKHMLSQRNDAFREWLPRLLFAGAISVGSLVLMGQLIEMQNTAVVSIQGVLATAGVGRLSLPLGVINWGTAPFYEVIAYSFELGGLVIIGGQMLARLALLDLLIVLAPVGLLLFPRVWFQFFIYTLSVQFLQVLCIAMGSALFAGVGHSDTSPLSWVVGIAAVVIASKIPGMIFHQLRAGLGDPHLEMLSVTDSAVQIASIAFA